MDNLRYSVADVTAQRDAPPSPVYQSIFDEINERIRSGEWPPGERLPSISSLAKQFNVSTGSVREALRALQSIGCVAIEHGRGVFVSRSGPLAPMAGGAKEHTDDALAVPLSVLVALCETRSIIEPELAALAAARATDYELLEVERLARALERKVADGLDLVDTDLQFHRLIAHAARNPVLYRMFDSVSDLLVASVSLTSVEPGMTARAVRYHLLIGDALRGRDAPQSRLLMLAHMNDSLSSLLTLQARIEG